MEEIFKMKQKSFVDTFFGTPGSSCESLLIQTLLKHWVKSENTTQARSLPQDIGLNI